MQNNNSFPHQNTPHNTSLMRTIILIISFTFLLTTGCAGTNNNFGTNRGKPIPQTVPTYEEFAQIQNDRVSKVDRYWSAIKMKLSWYDEEAQKKRTESGEGHLIFERPNKVALTFSKVGEIGFWAGSNDELFWVFEGGDSKQAFVGRNVNAFQPCCESLPISVHPLEVIDLAGLFTFPIATNKNDSQNHHDPAVGYSSKYGAWKLDIPGVWSFRRVYIDTTTFLPIRVELRSRLNRDISYGSADLSEYVRLNIRGKDEQVRPWVPAHFELKQSGIDGSVTLDANRPLDRTARGPIRKQVFQYEAVARSMKPREIHILDRRCPDSAETIIHPK